MQIKAWQIASNAQIAVNAQKSVLGGIADTATKASN
jgi:hypothetical protein